MATLETSSATQPSRPISMTTWFHQRALVAYVLLTFALTWPLMWAEVLGSWKMIPFRLTFSGVGLSLTLWVAYGPTLAALIITGINGGREGIRTLLGRLLIWRVGWPWYAAAILLPGLISLGANTLSVVRGSDLPAQPNLSWGMLLVLPISFLVRGILNGEEIGWRGVALPYLLQRWSAFVSSLLLGVIWALFHLPIFFVQGQSILGSQNMVNPLAFLVEVVAGAILVTWLFNNTNGSLLIAYLYHAAVNTWTTEIFHLNSIDSAIVTVIVAGVVVAIFGPTQLSRKTVSAKRV